MKGIAYGVGVGPGDPELMTLKAVQLIRENDVIAFPGRDTESSTAYRIASEAVPELEKKERVPLYIPMTRDPARKQHHHRYCANRIEAYLDQGKNVIYLTLGDPAIYCTFTYLQRILEEDGYETKMVSGIPSFCAAAATLNQPLCEWDEPLHIIPAAHREREPLTLPGNYVLMKSGKRLAGIREQIHASGREAALVENCGMPQEKVYRGLEEMPEETGYFSLVIAKERRKVL